VTVLKFCRLSWCSASREFVSYSWATSYIYIIFIFGIKKLQSP